MYPRNSRTCLSINTTHNITSNNNVVTEPYPTQGNELGNWVCVTLSDCVTLRSEGYESNKCYMGTINSSSTQIPTQQATPLRRHLFERKQKCAFSAVFRGHSLHRSCNLFETGDTPDRPCSLLTIRSFGARDGLGLSVRVWLGFGLGGSVRAIDSLSDAV
eukprot:sb/3472887/